jgi:hypothetical protein
MIEPSIMAPVAAFPSASSPSVTGDTGKKPKRRRKKTQREEDTEATKTAAILIYQINVH